MNDPRTILTDAAYVAIGFGVVAVQSAQTRRRDLESQVGDVRKLVEERVTGTVDELRRRVPQAAVTDAVNTAVGAAKDATGQLLDLVRPQKSATAA